jgi:hypothetical protein
MLLFIAIFIVAAGVAWLDLMRDTSADFAPDWWDGGEPGAGLYVGPTW